MCSSNAAPAEARGPTNNQLTQEQEWSGGKKKAAGTCESGGTTGVRTGGPSCCSSLAAAGTSVGAIPPPSLRWSLVQALAYGRVCHQVRGLASGGGAGGGGGGAAHAAVAVCPQEIRKTKSTALLDDSSYSYRGGGPAPSGVRASVRRKHNPAPAGLK